MPPSILITGGAGFIGSHLAARLARSGTPLTIVDNLSTGVRANLESLPPHCYRFIHADLAHAITHHPDLLNGVSHVYHLAATVGVGRVLDDPAAMIRNNVEQTAALLDACANRKITVLLTSSSEVYGQSDAMPLSEDSPLVFGDTTSPRSSYGMTKALDEHLAFSHHARGHLRAVVVRLFNTIGPRQVGRYGMVVPRFVAAAVANRAHEIHGDGTQTRSFCDVRDIVSAMVALAENPATHGRVYNVGSTHEISINALADRINILAGTHAKKTYIPYAEIYGPGFTDPARRVPDLSRIHHAIGYRPQHSLDDTLTQLIELARHRHPPQTALKPSA